MDRRQRKTRKAIFEAFTKLLEKESYTSITVQEIIDEADVGRTTFYAHFPTKEQLLDALCDELFAHIIENAREGEAGRGLYSDASAPRSAVCHLLHHIKEDRTIITLLRHDGSGVFLQHFRKALTDFVTSEFREGNVERSRDDLPQDFLVNHLVGSFIEMVLWWIGTTFKRSPEELDHFFHLAVDPLI